MYSKGFKTVKHNSCENYLDASGNPVTQSVISVTDASGNPVTGRNKFKVKVYKSLFNKFFRQEKFPLVIILFITDASGNPVTQSVVSVTDSNGNPVTGFAFL